MPQDDEYPAIGTRDLRHIEWDVRDAARFIRLVSVAFRQRERDPGQKYYLRISY